MIFLTRCENGLTSCLIWCSSNGFVKQSFIAKFFAGMFQGVTHGFGIMKRKGHSQRKFSTTSQKDKTPVCWFAVPQ